MKRFVFIALSSVLVFAASCSDDDGNNGRDEPVPALITPDINVRMAEPLSLHPFTGVLEIYPCNSESSVYYGNYINGKLSVFYGYYTIVDGDVSG